MHIRLALVAALLVAIALGTPPTPADGDPAPGACPAACGWALEVCLELAANFLEQFPGPVGHKYYVLQTWACYASAAACFEGC